MFIDHREVTSDSQVLIVAELSANHNGSLKIAEETIRAAKRTGADAIKLQTYTPDTITINSEKDDFIVKSNSIWDGRTYYDLYKEAHTPFEWHQRLFEVAQEESLICFSSPFDETAVDLLESLNCPAYKIASFEITDIPLIKRVAKTGKPVILSTGIATKEDIELAVNACRENKNNDIAILKCTSSYPAPIEEANLRMIKEYKKEFGVEVGLSDHTMGTVVPTVAVALGAKIIEKHFILDKSIGGPDASFSLDENEFSQLVHSIRSAEKAMGKVNYDLSEKQIKSRSFSRSLYVVQDIRKGDAFSTENIRSIRPGFGMHPKYFEEVLGKIARCDLERGTSLSNEYIDW